MGRKLKCFILVLLCCLQAVRGQGNAEKILTGTVMYDKLPLQGISIVNTSNKTMAVSDAAGCFSIMAKTADLLDFSGIDLKGLRKYVYKFEYNSGTIEIIVPVKAIALEEVVVGNAGLSAERLGLIPKGQKRLTQQERKLYSASKGLAGLLVGNLKELKMNVEVEKKELLLRRLDDLFEHYYYTNTLHIPADLIRGFQYYCVEDSGFVESLNGKDKNMTGFLMANLATQYKEMRLENP